VHICQDEVNAFLLAVPFVGFALAWARSVVRHGWRALVGKFRRPR